MKLNINSYQINMDDELVFLNSIAYRKYRYAMNAMEQFDTMMEKAGSLSEVINCAKRVFENSLRFVCWSETARYKEILGIDINATELFQSLHAYMEGNDNSEFLFLLRKAQNVAEENYSTYRDKVNDRERILREAGENLVGVGTDVQSILRAGISERVASLGTQIAGIGINSILNMGSRIQVVQKNRRFLENSGLLDEMKKALFMDVSRATTICMNFEIEERELNIPNTQSDDLEKRLISLENYKKSDDIANALLNEAQWNTKIFEAWKLNPFNDQVYRYLLKYMMSQSEKIYAVMKSLEIPKEELIVQVIEDLINDCEISDENFMNVSTETEYRRRIGIIESNERKLDEVSRDIVKYGLVDKADSIFVRIDLAKLGLDSMKKTFAGKQYSTVDNALKAVSSASRKGTEKEQLDRLIVENFWDSPEDVEAKIKRVTQMSLSTSIDKKPYLDNLQRQLKVAQERKKKQEEKERERKKREEEERKKRCTYKNVCYSSEEEAKIACEEDEDLSQYIHKLDSYQIDELYKASLELKNKKYKVISTKDIVAKFDNKINSILSDRFSKYSMQQHSEEEMKQIIEASLSLNVEDVLKNKILSELKKHIAISLGYQSTADRMNAKVMDYADGVGETFGGTIFAIIIAGIGFFWNRVVFIIGGIITAICLIVLLFKFIKNLFILIRNGAVYASSGMAYAFGSGKRRKNRKVLNLVTAMFERGVKTKTTDIAEFIKLF